MLKFEIKRTAYCDCCSKSPRDGVVRVHTHIDDPSKPADPILANKRVEISIDICHNCADFIAKFGGH
jgi:hypothetical protein